MFVAALALCVRALNTAETVSTLGENGMRIVLDAGHGGIDGGVTGKETGVKESDLNLSIVRLLKEELTGIGFDVVLTRKTENGLYGTTAKGFKKRDMQRRKEIIEEADPALVVSVHQNFFSSRAMRGAQVFYSRESEGGKKLALATQERLNGLYATQGVKARTIMSGEYFMLECAACPSVIVECGFLSNAADEGLLCSKEWQKKLASSIASGIVAYFADSAA